MKKKSLMYMVVMATLLTSCGNKNINDDLDSANLDTTFETVVNNETMMTTSQPKIVTDLKSENTQIQINVGETLQLEYSLLPKNTPLEYSTIDWSSTDETIITVDENGVLTGIENGICTVIATSRNNPDVVLKYNVTVSGGNNVVKVVQASTIYVPTSEFTILTTTTTTTTTTNLHTNPPVDLSPQEPQEPITEVPQETMPPETEPPQETVLETTTITTEIKPTYINTILIVNNSCPLPVSYAPPSDTIWGDYGLINDVQQAFDIMNNDATSMGLNLTINSGYISYDEQNNRYQNAVDTYGQDYADHYVDQAGYSESQTGLSILLNSANSEFDNTAEASWIAENCYKYGFIVRYPQGKESYTGKSYRSYQIRYVGIDIATEMYNQNLCLEEYLK